MVGPQEHTKMERIIAARYGPLILPTPLNAMPTGEYHKYRLISLGLEVLLLKSILNHSIAMMIIWTLVKMMCG